MAGAPHGSTSGRQAKPPNATWADPRVCGRSLTGLVSKSIFQGLRRGRTRASGADPGVRPTKTKWHWAKPPVPPRTCPWLPAITVGILLTLIPLRAADLSLEYQVKAAFLLNFTRFIEWPTDSAGAATPAAICILGEDPFGPALDRMVGGETLQGRRLEVLRVRQPLPASCKVLFISRSEKDIPAILQSLDSGVLTVSEGGGFLQAGGIVDFIIDSHRVRFDISQSAAAKAKLKISSKLLNVARSVEK